MVNVEKPKASNDSRIAGMILMRTPLSGHYRTTDPKAAQLGKLLRTVFAALKRPNAPNGPRTP